MTIDTTTDTCYITDGDGLWTCDLATASCTQLLTQFDDGGTQVTNFWEIATDTAGNFWGFSIEQADGDGGTDSLYELDINTGSVTLLGPYTGPGGNSGSPQFTNQGMDWDPVSGQLIYNAYTGGGSGSYGTWNTTTGVFSLILEHANFPVTDARIGGPIACFGGTTFQANFFLGRFLTYDTLDPTSNLTDVPEGGPPQLWAMDFDATETTLYAVDRVNFFLGTIDTHDWRIHGHVGVDGRLPN